MIRQIVNSIIEAENEAEKIAAAAQADCAGISAAAEEEAVRILASANEDAKNLIKKNKEQSALKAEEAKRERIEKGIKEAAEMNKRYEKNLEAAVGAVKESLIKTWR